MIATDGRPRTFDQCLTEHADAHPESVAVVDAAVRLSYGVLEQEVSALARQLSAAGVGPGSRIALIADNSARHLVTAFAVWRAGAVLVTVYPSSTEAELRYALSVARPTLVIAASRLHDSVTDAARDLDAPVHELTDDGAVDGLPAPSAGIGVQVVDPDASALICFTSGSTANPKAVMHTHSGLCAAALAYADVWHLGPDDTTLVALPLAWAFGLVTTSMATLAAGGTVVLLARSRPEDVLANVAAHEVTFFAGVTTMYVKMLQALDASSVAPRPSSLRLCISGGEPRNEVAFARWHELTKCPVHDVYAASECFPVVTYDPVTDPLPRPGCAGRVVPGAQLRLVDGDGNDVAPGTPGHAWTRGPAMTTGYWADPDLTAAALTPDGWYRTGDLVDIDADGYVRVLGRLTDLIIRGGANVSPAEVEDVVARRPDIAEVAVVGLPDPDYGECVVAAVVPRADADVDVLALRAHCVAALAGYKVPTRFVVLDALPRNASTGKVNRREVARLLSAVDVSTGDAS